MENERRENDRTVTDVRHTVAIQYSYSVGGREYLGEGIQPYSYGMQNSAAACEQSEHYRPNMAVRVAYHPSDPSEAYLEPGLSSVSCWRSAFSYQPSDFGSAASRSEPRRSAFNLSIAVSPKELQALESNCLTDWTPSRAAWAARCSLS